MHRIDLSLVLADIMLVILSAITITRLITSRNQPYLRLAGAAQLRDWVWFPVILCFWPLLVLAGNTIDRLFALPLPPSPASPDVPLPFIILESFFWTRWFGGPLNEEPGWRAFALPRLQNRFGPLVASIILSATWAVWHVPEHIAR